MSEHTPGPWAIREEPIIGGAVYWVTDPRDTYGPRQQPICQIQPCDNDAANARLIAAAPDLYAVAGACAAYFEYGTPNEDHERELLGRLMRVLWRVDPETWQMGAPE